MRNDIYRPVYNCGMRALGVAFCMPCNEAHARRVHDYALLAGPPIPSSGSTVTVLTTQTFQPTGDGFQYFTCLWKLNGAAVAATQSVGILPGQV